MVLRRRLEYIAVVALKSVAKMMSTIKTCHRGIRSEWTIMSGHRFEPDTPVPGVGGDMGMKDAWLMIDKY